MEITSISGPEYPVSLSLSGLPSHTSYVFDPKAATPPGSGSTQSALRISTEPTTPPSTYSLTVTGSSNEKTKTAYVTLEVIDNMPPMVEVLSPESMTYTADSVPLVFAVSEPTSWIGYSLDGQANATITEDISFIGLFDGTHYITVYAIDTFGNSGSSGTVGFTMASPVHDGAVLSVVPSATEVIKGDAINISVAVKNEGTESEDFDVAAYCDSDVIDTHSSISLLPGTSTTLLFTWKTDSAILGDHSISAQINRIPGEMDTDDNTFTYGTIEVTDSLVAVFTYSAPRPLANETVSFDATPSYAHGGDIVEYNWDFGDGWAGQGIAVDHKYVQLGTYNVTLTVTDDEGFSSACGVTINALVHNLAVMNIAPTANEINEGQTLNVTVLVENNGNFTETFDVTIHANNTAIQTNTVFNLAPATQASLTFTWFTEGVKPGNYTMSAEIRASGETYGGDDIKVGAVVKVVPEFPSFLILPLFMVVTLFIFIVYRKSVKRFSL